MTTITPPCAGLAEYCAPNEHAFRTDTELMDLCLWVVRDLCATCPARAACITTVAPQQTAFDGVCGGRVWRNGRVLATCDSAHPDELEETQLRPPCGTEAAVAAHNRAGEPVGPSCRQAERTASRKRRENRHRTNRGER